MNDKIKVIIKKPKEQYGSITTISHDLRTFQNIVGGYIEVVPLDAKHAVICNEEGIRDDLDANIRFGDYSIVGTVIIAGLDWLNEAQDFSDIEMDMPTWISRFESREIRNFEYYTIRSI